MDQENADQSRKLLQRTASGKLNCIMTNFSLHAIEAQIGDDSELLMDVLNGIRNSLGLEVVSTKISEEVAVAGEMKGSDLTFDDQLQYFVALKEGADVIVSFDSDFDSTDLEIERKEPSEII